MTKRFLTLTLLLSSLVASAQISYVAWTLGVHRGSFTYTPLLFDFSSSGNVSSPVKATGYQTDKYSFTNWKIAIEVIQPRFILSASTNNPFKKSTFENAQYLIAKNHTYLDMRFALGLPIKNLLSIYAGTQFSLFNNDVYASPFSRGIYYSTGSIQGTNNTDKVSAWSGGFSGNLCVTLYKGFFIRGTVIKNFFNNKTWTQKGNNLQYEVMLYGTLKNKGKSNVGFNAGILGQQFTVNPFNFENGVVVNKSLRAAPEVKMKLFTYVVSLNIPIKFWD